jgi:hypothetical protein
LAGESRDIGAGVLREEDKRLGKVEAAVVSDKLDLRQLVETQRSG